jgi:hypothetical protein
MLAYFHYLNKASRPFALDWDLPSNVAMAELNAEQVQFAKETAEQVQARSEYFYNRLCRSQSTNVPSHLPESTFEKVRESEHFENEYYFLSQLYDMDWKPSPTV